MCVEGHRLAVWDEDVEPKEMETDLMVEHMEEQGVMDHLRGANWHVLSVDQDMLDDLESEFGGERSDIGWPALD